MHGYINADILPFEIIYLQMCQKSTHNTCTHEGETGSKILVYEWYNERLQWSHIQNLLVYWTHVKPCHMKHSCGKSIRPPGRHSSLFLTIKVQITCTAKNIIIKNKIRGFIENPRIYEKSADLRKSADYGKSVNYRCPFLVYLLCVQLAVCHSVQLT